MPYRKSPLANGEIYHVFTKSIAGFKIFNSIADFERILKTMVFYSTQRPPCKLSLYLKKLTNSNPAVELGSVQKIVKIIAYCIMPTHIHMILQQLEEDGISRFINLMLQSYSKYFNLKHKRKGPLWESRFKNVLVETDEQFLHLTRYIHLNPTTAYLVNEPKDWIFSSYREYIDLVKQDKAICNFSDYLGMDAFRYAKFVKDFVDYERNFWKIKHLILE